MLGRARAMRVSAAVLVREYDRHLDIVFFRPL